jgi:hypothetical protein
LTFRDQQRRDDPSTQLLYVLDDRTQAEYTSMHVMNRDALDRPHLALMSPEERHRYEHQLELTPSRWTETITRNLGPRIQQASLSDAVGRLRALDDEEIRLIERYDDPTAVFESPLHCATISASEPSMAIAAQPNGYFQGDLSPAENYLLAEQLRIEFGFELLGLGSFLAAYVRPEPCTLSETTAVVESIRFLYRDMTDTVARRWALAAANRRWFLLHYEGG